MFETFAFAIALNGLMFLIAFLNKTDKLTDISYALTFAGIATFGIYRNEMNLAKWLVAAFVFLWAFRLGSYLLFRIHVMGRDKRFDDKRSNFWKFGQFWILQAITAWIVMLPVTFLLQSDRSVSLTAVTIVGLIVAVFGLLIETEADGQKFRFIQNKENKGKWIESGLWKYSRHPNYFGEMLVWYGVYLACYSWLADANAIVALLSPMFISIMLVSVSGIPLLEKSADKKWGNNKKYQDYKKRTSILVLMPNRR